MNTNLEENFSYALDLCEKELSHECLIELLKNGIVAERQFAALSITKLDTNDIPIFISNLTGCDGKIREAIASRLEEFLTKESAASFIPFYKTFANATIDINANISRMVIDAIIILKNNPEFGKNYSGILVKFINEAFEEIGKIKFRDKKYVLNKQLFKMYWALEGLIHFHPFVEKNVLKEILTKVLARPEYTIREKAANILVQLSTTDDNYQELLDKIAEDENFYVKRVLEK